MANNKTPNGQAGFSLLEALVALVVLSVSAKAFLSAAETYTQSAIAVTDRVVALWVAENRLTEIYSSQIDVPNSVEMAGKRWRVATVVTATRDPALSRFEVSVSQAATPDAPLAWLTGYAPTPEASL